MDDCAALEDRLTLAQKVLNVLEEQAAGHTNLTIPPHLKVELEGKREEVAQLKEQLTRMRLAGSTHQKDILIAISRPSPMRLRVPDEHYVERDSAKRLLGQFSASLQQPEKTPLLFNIYGIGGVGKTTLLGRLKEANIDEVDFLEVCFTKTAGIETPLKLMRKLHQQAVDEFEIETERDAFKQLDHRFETTLFELRQKNLEGEPNGSEDNKRIASWFERLVWLGPTATASNTSKASGDYGLGLSNTAAIGENSEDLQEWIQHIVRNHPVTKDDLELQALMLNPVSRLTQGFAESLMQSSKTRNRPLVVVLDTYEKAQTYLNQWLWQHLVEDTTLYASAVRLVVVGRRSLQSDEGWRKLNQDRKLLYEVPLEKFIRSDTLEYLEKIGITSGSKRAKIFKVTQGLPYYLDWVRKQHEQGIKPDFSQGNQAIAELLLQGLDSYQKNILQVMACCRWFDLSVVRYLLGSAELGIEAKDVNTAENCFEWLKKSDFVGLAKGRYALDDVARDVFRQSFFQEDQGRFRKTHALLADFFKQQADEVVGPQELLPECYEDEDWRRLTSESLYHGLFGKGKEGLRQYIEHFFAAVYLRQPDVFMTPFAFVRSEINKENQDLVHKSTSRFIDEAEMAVGFGWLFLDKHPESYKLNLEDKDGNKLSEESIETHKKKVENSLQTLLGHVESLQNGLGKGVGMMSKSLRSTRGREKRDGILEAKRQAEVIALCCRPKLASSLFLNIGNGLRTLKMYEEALYCYQNALDKDQSNVSILLSQAEVLRQLKRYEDALDSCEKTTEIDSESANAWSIQGDTLIDLKRYQEALGSYKRALKLDPKAHYWFNQGVAFSLLEKHEEALDSCQKTTEVDPGLAIAWSFQGGVLIDLERWEEALYSCQKAIELAPTLTQGWRTYSRALLNMHRYDEALTYCNKALEIKPEDSGSLNNLALILSILGDPEEAIKVIDKAIVLEPDDALYKANKGIVLARAGQHLNALFECDQATEQDPDHESGYYAKACCHALQGNVYQAIDSLQKAIDIKPRFSRHNAKYNPDFDGIRNDERFQVLIYGTQG